MQNCADEAAHNLCAGIAARAAIRFSVDDEGVVGAVDESDAALAAVYVPDECAACAVDPLARRIDRGGRLCAAGANTRVTPHCSWTERERSADRCDGDDRRSHASGDDRRCDSQQRKKNDHGPPGSRRGQKRKQPESAGERAGDRTGSVPCVCQTHVPAHLVPSAA